MLSIAALIYFSFYIYKLCLHIAYRYININFVFLSLLIFSEIMQTIQGKWIKQFGRIYRSWLGFRTFVHISTPHFVEVEEKEEILL